MILFDPVLALHGKRDPLFQIFGHGEGCLQGCRDGEPVRRGSGRIWAPCSGPQRVGVRWENAGKNRRIWGPDGPLTTLSCPPARTPLGKIEDHQGYDGDRGGLGQIGCHLLHGDVPDGYAKGAVCTSTDSSVCQHVDVSCYFRCVHLAAMATFPGGDLVGAVPMMVIPPTPDLLFKCMYLKLSMVLRVSLHTSKKVFAPFACCSAHSDGVVHDVFWAGADDHGLEVKLDAIEWLILVYFDQNLEAISNLCFLSMIFAAQGLECPRCDNTLTVSLWSKANITAIILKHRFCSQTTIEIHRQQRSWSCLYACKTIISGKVQNHFFIITICTVLYLSDDQHVEDVVLPLFGLCHQRWTTTPLSLIPRFNGGDTWRLSSVMVPQNLQLNPYQPRVHTPDRPLGEPPTGHQLVWSMIEALEDCRCSNIESVLSADERSLFGFIGNLWHQLHVFRSCFFLIVLLGTCDSCSTFCRRDMLYYELQ